MFKTQEVMICVKKDMTTSIAVGCYSHEIPVYEAAHAEGEISLTSKGEVKEMEAGEAFEEMMHKFGAHPDTGVPLAEYIYGVSGHQLENGDFTISDDIKGTAESETKEDVKAPELSLDKLREYLDELGVEYKAKMNKGTLQKLIEDTAASMTERLEAVDAYVPDDPLAMKAILDAMEDEAA